MCSNVSQAHLQYGGRQPGGGKNSPGGSAEIGAQRHTGPITRAPGTAGESGRLCQNQAGTLGPWHRDATQTGEASRRVGVRL